MGNPIQLSQAEPGFDIIVFKRGHGDQPGPEIIKAPGHVGFFAGYPKQIAAAPTTKMVSILGGNQSDEVNVRSFPIGKILGVRRLMA